MFNKILVPIDFSDCSVNATRYAAALCKRTNGRLVLMHSLNVPVTHGEIGATSILGELTSGIEEDVEEGKIKEKGMLRVLGRYLLENFVKNSK